MEWEGVMEVVPPEPLVLCQREWHPAHKNQHAGTLVMLTWLVLGTDNWLVGWLVFNDIFSTNWLYRVIGVWNISCRAGGQHKHIIKQWNNTINKKIINTTALGFVETIPSPRLGFLRGVFLANHVASTDNLTRTKDRTNTNLN